MRQFPNPLILNPLILSFSIPQDTPSVLGFAIKWKYILHFGGT